MTERGIRARLGHLMEHMELDLTAWRKDLEAGEEWRWRLLQCLELKHGVSQLDLTGLWGLLRSLCHNWEFLLALEVCGYFPEDAHPDARAYVQAQRDAFHRSHEKASQVKEGES